MPRAGTVFSTIASFRPVANGILGALAFLAAVPATAAAPPRLRLLDDRGSKIDAAVKVCFYRGLETVCFEKPPYEVPPSIQDFDSLTAEGPAHGPVHFSRGEIRFRGLGEQSIRIPRKAFLTIQGLPSDPVTLSLYSRDDANFRKPAFRFERVKTAGLRIPAGGFVLALSDGRSAPHLKLLVAKPGAPYSVSYRRRPGWSLLFRSLGTRGTPVGRAAAVLLSAAPPGQERELSRTASERDGLGVLSGVTEPFATLSVSGAGYLKQSVPGLTAGRGTFTFREVILERGGTVRAVVTLDGAPAAGAACQLVSTQLKRSPGSRLPGSEVLAEDRVSEKGNCATPRMPRGDYVFRVIPKGSGNSNDESVKILDDQTTDLEVKLRRYSVSGTVRRGQKPEAGAVVFVTNDADFPEFPAGRSAPPEPLKVETDEEGHYEGTVWKSGRYTFSLVNKAMMVGSTRSAEVGYDGAVVDFQLNDSDISGVVVDQHEKPIPNAWVTLILRIPEVGWEHRYGSGDDAGRFVFPFEGNGHIVLEAGKDGYKNSDRVELDVSDSQPIAPQKIVLTRLDTLEGHVLWASGGPASGVGVLAFDGSPNRPPISVGTVVTEPDGHFSVAKAPGPSTRIFVTGAGCPLLVADVVNDAEEKRLRCAAVSSGLLITMKKTDGTLVQDEQVLLRWNGVLIPRQVLNSHLAFLGMPNGTDGAGRLTIVALPPGTYDVFLQAGSSEATISEGLQHGFISSVTLAPMGTAELEVRVE